MGRRDLSISKRQLAEFTGIPTAAECVERLHSRFAFSGGVRMFDFKDEYHALRISNWRTFADPSADETNRKNAYRYQEEIKAAGKLLRETALAKAARTAAAKAQAR